MKSVCWSDAAAHPAQPGSPARTGPDDSSAAGSGWLPTVWGAGRPWRRSCVSLGKARTCPTTEPAAAARRQRQVPLRSDAVFVALYTLSYLGTCLLLIAPLAVTLGAEGQRPGRQDAAPGSLALVVGAGSVVSLFGNPLFGRLSDRTSSRLGMRRPWMVGGLVGGTVGVLVVATAPNVATGGPGLVHRAAVLQCGARRARRGAAGPGPLGAARSPCPACWGSACPSPLSARRSSSRCSAGTSWPCSCCRAPSAASSSWSSPSPCTTGTGHRRRQADDGRCASSWARSYVNPRRHPDFAWAFLSRFLLVMAYAFLTTYQVYFLLQRLHRYEADIPNLVFLGDAGAVVRRRRGVPGRWPAVGPGRPAQGVRAGCCAGLRPGDGAAEPRRTTSPRSCVAVALERVGVRAVLCRRPGAGGRRAARTRTTPRRTWACSTTRAPFRSRLRRRWRPAILAVGGGNYGFLYAGRGTVRRCGGFRGAARQGSPVMRVASWQARLATGHPSRRVSSPALGPGSRPLDDH